MDADYHSASYDRADMTREEELLERWTREEPMYLAWGKMVAEHICGIVKHKIVHTDIDLFLRLPIKPRLKTAPSLIQKAFYRQKPYKDPYDEVEDKVGIRFVVLLSYDIRTIESAIRDSADMWNFEMARDFEIEKLARPMEFGYQSLHYVVRAKHGHRHGELEIIEGTPCEVQVRTLLQHAYSELTHDTIYKPSVTATPEMKRAAAKSMALIEATDDYFAQVADLIAKSTEVSHSISEILAEQYEKSVDCEPEGGALHSLLVDHYKIFAADGFKINLSAFLESKPYIAKLISERYRDNALYRVSAILLVYYAVAEAPLASKQDSPVDDEDLSIIYSDLGLQL